MSSKTNAYNNPIYKSIRKKYVMTVNCIWHRIIKTLNTWCWSTNSNISLHDETCDRL